MKSQRSVVDQGPSLGAALQAIYNALDTCITVGVLEWTGGVNNLERLLGQVLSIGHHLINIFFSQLYDLLILFSKKPNFTFFSIR